MTFEYQDFPCSYVEGKRIYQQQELGYCTYLTRSKMSVSRQGKKQTDRWTPEYREKQRLAQIGKKRPPRTQLHAAKISESLKRAWTHRREASVHIS